ncbi:MAG: 50S ribosomal protein L6 [Rhodospirillaceae bacterium]|jgi:large subunit ribosomal protein L6|nr:50S ribosomal protein L6 [Rhodospirillaceae bacterium]MBT6137057.1 50S ribosomal protein L6 [Rhodospirillaceae bacterium]
MSRVGKYPIEIPSGVTIEVAGDAVKAKGKLGELTMALTNEVEVSVNDNQVSVAPKSTTKRSRQMWGTTRSRINSMVQGVSEGFTVELEINGVGYRAAVEGKALALSLGFSHPVNYPIPDDITIKCERPTAISVHGADKQRVGQIAAEIRAYRPPEPFKGKGVKYANETILRKEGKKK